MAISARNRIPVPLRGFRASAHEAVGEQSSSCVGGRLVIPGNEGRQDEHREVTLLSWFRVRLAGSEPVVPDPQGTLRTSRLVLLRLEWATLASRILSWTSRADDRLRSAEPLGLAACVVADCFVVSCDGAVSDGSSPRLDGECGWLRVIVFLFVRRPS